LPPPQGRGWAYLSQSMHFLLYLGKAEEVIRCALALFDVLGHFTDHPYGFTKLSVLLLVLVRIGASLQVLSPPQNHKSECWVKQSLCADGPPFYLGKGKNLP
jgi:hypothetical protein